MDVDIDSNNNDSSSDINSDTNSSESIFSQPYMTMYINIIVTTLLAILSGRYNKQDYHTSALSGLGVYLHVFEELIRTLWALGHVDSCDVKLEEQLAIFLYTCVTGLTIRHVGERFQHSNDTIAKYFKKMLYIFSSPPFYTTYITLPLANDPIPHEIQNNPKWAPYFGGAVGAIDGTHIFWCPPKAEQVNSRNRKGTITQNCLIACSGWEGSASDFLLYHEARTTDFRIPASKYYLADAGFPSCDTLLVPYRDVRYHLAEWGRASVRPANKEELYNLRHASARNVVERIFGILKRRFRILRIASEYHMDLQVRIPPALCAMHNFIRQHDPEEFVELDEPVEFPEEVVDEVLDFQEVVMSNVGDLVGGQVEQAEWTRAAVRRDQIAQAMWNDYQHIIQARRVANS